MKKSVRFDLWLALIRCPSLLDVRDTLLRFCKTWYKYNLIYDLLRCRWNLLYWMIYPEIYIQCSVADTLIDEKRQFFFKILTSGNVNIFEVLFRALPKGARSCDWLHIWFILCFSLFLLFLKLDISKKIFRFISLYFMLFNLIVPFFLFLELYIVLFALSRTILCLLTVFVGCTCLHSICSILLSSPTVAAYIQYVL